MHLLIAMLFRIIYLSLSVMAFKGVREIWSYLKSGVITLVLVTTFGSTTTSAADSSTLEPRKGTFDSFLKSSPQNISVIIRTKRQAVSDRLERSQRTPKSDTNITNGEATSVMASHFSEAMAKLSTKAQGSRRSRFTDPSLMSVAVTDQDLQILLNDPELDVFPNRFYSIALDASIPLIFGNQAVAGFNGSGTSVALLDTGVDASHSFLDGAVVASSAACFSNNDNMGEGESLCPNGMGQQIGSGSANACDAAVPGCGHGAQMAGIIAGMGASFNGVATGASVIPIQVFTKFSDPANPDHVTACGDVSAVPCIRTQTADLIRALEYIQQIGAASNVGAVNISFGTEGPFQGQCQSAAETIINSITSSGRAVIASSGNQSDSNAMSSPACIPSVISVASTNVADVPSAFNNRSSELDFFAPGELINSSVPGNTFMDASGTSAAAAHVSGAWAVLKEKNSSASVSQVKNALISSGVSVSQGLFTKPRIRVGEALEVLAAEVLAAAPEIDDELCITIVASNGKVAIVCL